MSANPSNPLQWTLREIARLERGGLRPPRLTEPDHERWNRVRRKLGWAAFIELLHQDVADAFPTSFALERWTVSPVAGLDEAAAKALVTQAGQPDESDTLAFLRVVCRGLGLMDGGNVAALPKVQTHQRALELPGCGGRIAAYQATTHAGVSFHEHFTFVADTDEERVAIGIAAAELRANAPKVLTTAELAAGRPRFDHVFGIQGYPLAERVAAELALVRAGVRLAYSRRSAHSGRAPRRLRGLARNGYCSARGPRRHGPVAYVCRGRHQSTLGRRARSPDRR